MIPSFVVIVPAVDPTLARQCVASMAAEVAGQTFIVDNTAAETIEPLNGCKVLSAPSNLGVAESWNLGIDIADDNLVDYLWIVSTSMTFGPPGGRDFVEELEQRQPAHIMHTQFGWHCLALSREVWEAVGRFDPVFPYYGTDTDLLYRMGLAGLPSPRENGGELDQIDIDATCLPDGQTLRSGLVDIDYQQHFVAYERKFGGPQGSERWTHPYNDLRLDFTHIGPPPERT